MILKKGLLSWPLIYYICYIIPLSLFEKQCLFDRNKIKIVSYVLYYLIVIISHCLPCIVFQLNELELAKTEMIDVKEENVRLKKMLERIENDYRSLQLRFFDILQHERSPSITMSENKSLTTETRKEEEEEEPEVSLSLGFQVLNKRKKDDNNNTNSSTSSVVKEDTKLMSEGLSLGFGRKSPPTSDLSDKESGKSTEIDDAKEDGVGDTWRPSKLLKTMKDGVEEDEPSQPNITKRARVSVRARCDTPTVC